MEFPSADDYVRAVQQPAQVFAAPDLKTARFDVHPLLGVPMPASGSTAVVFKAEVSGEEQALRFFTREDASSRDRYAALGRYVQVADLVGNVAKADWVDDAIRIGGQSWPMVRMQWVEGRTLDQYVDHLVAAGDLHAIGALAGTWRDLVQRMQGAWFAHGDLQHGNVLVDKRGVLRLVDFDCVWITPFAGESPPTETGHRNYQRPGESWGPLMDTFPGLVIYLSLLALSRNPRPWETLNNGENLLFRREDFDPPFRTAAWQHLAALRDPVLDRMAARLKECCDPGWRAAENLETVLTGTEVLRPGSSHAWVEKARRRHEERHGPAPKLPQAEAPPASSAPNAPLPPPPPKEQPTSPPRNARPSHDPPPFPAPGPWPPPQPGSGTWWDTAQPPGTPPTGPPGLERSARIWKAAGLGYVVGLVVGIIAIAIAANNGSSGGLAFWVAFFLAGGTAFGLALLVAARRPPGGPGQPP